MNNAIKENELEKVSGGTNQEVTDPHAVVDSDVCIGCGACEARCPYQLPIRKMLKNVVNLMEK